MAADRGRDLPIRILSDLDRFDVDPAAEGLERLGDAAKDAGTQVRDLDDDTRKGGRSLDELGDDARKTAARVDDAFDKIARSSKATSRKVDTDMDRMGRSLKDTGDEIGGTAREAAASFGGSFDDIADAGQEAAANVAFMFGPAGAVAGIVAAGGIAMLRADAEKLKEQVSELVEEMIGAGGRITDAFIDTKLEEWARDGTLLKIKEQAADLDITYRDLARAKAGDADATERVVKRMGELAAGLDGTVKAHGPAAQAAYDLQTKLSALSGELSTNREAQRLAKEAINAVGEASSGTAGKVTRSAHVTGAAWDDLRGNLGRPITARVQVSAPSAAEIDAVNRAIRRGIGTIVVPVRAGQSKFANTSSNSRYRE